MNYIKRLLFLTSIILLGASAQAAEDRGGGVQSRNDSPDRAVTQERTAPQARPVRPAKASRPKAVRPARPSGKVNQAQAPRSAPAPNQSFEPVQRSAPISKQKAMTVKRSAPARKPAPVQRSEAVQQPYRAPAATSQQAPVRKPPANTRPYDRQRLTNLGVRTIPKPITTHSEILQTDRTHSVIRFPQTGPQGKSLQGSLVSARKFNNGTVRDQMSVVIQPSFSVRLDQERSGENQRDRNYWHSDNGFYYNHYIDDWGYHWYGWFRGNQYFWTRYYNRRWWWYDPDYDRWCYYQNNNWYWQDPTQQGEIYVYDNDSYISLDFNFQN